MKTTRKIPISRHRCKPNTALAIASRKSEEFWFLVFQIAKHLLALFIGAFSATTVTYEMPPTWWRVAIWIVLFYLSFAYFLYIIVGDKMLQFETDRKKYSR